ncbi:MAG: putative bifunctional diguanylate cyclase/phosphodiesterase [Gammaproteobacteria bacterium]
MPQNIHSGDGSVDIPGTLSGALRAARRELGKAADGLAPPASTLLGPLGERIEVLVGMAERMEALEDASLRLIGERSAESMSEVCLDAMQQVLEADVAALCLLDRGAGHGPFVATRGYAPDAPGTPGTASAIDPRRLPGLLLQREASLLLHAGATLDAALGPDHPALASLLGLPLCDHSHVYGWLVCGRAPGKPEFTAADVRMAARLGAQLAAAYDNLNLYQAVQRHALQLEREAGALAAAHHQVDFLSRHDPLTRLPNRPALVERIHHAVAQAQDGQHQIALLLFNIDRLARINDSLGHDTGDAMLQEMARRAATLAGPNDTLAHLGADEFVLLLGDCLDSDWIVATARRLIDELSKPVQVGGHDLIVTASVGISIYPRDGGHPSELLKAADVALSHMKEAGRNGFRFYKGEMNAHAQRWMAVETHLRRALERRELALHYQPQVSLVTGRICGMEALLRWTSPELGMVPPSDFIPLAEDTGLILPIGNWVIHEACRQCRAWQDAGLPPVRVAVNVSARQFMAGTVAEVVRDALAATGLSPEYLEIELTESVMMGDSELTSAQLNILTRMGVSVSLDDFGTGYSSLGYLSSFVLDKLKIDQAFVRNITSEPRSAAIARATVALAHGLSLAVTAEGVETDGQLEYLRSIGCNEVQGYLLSRPVPAEAMAKLLAAEQILLPPA